ncbi:MAG: hypothetical protein ACI9MC_001666 [Kiritimatiellia bacterium]|jgi:hypothetical protein
MRCALLFAMLLCLPAIARAECPGDCANLVVVDPLTTALGIVHVQFEGRIAPHATLYVGPSAHLFTLGDPEPYVGLGVEFGARFFLRPTAPTGWWFALRQVVAHLQTTDGTKVRSFGGYSSVLVGGTVIYKRLVLSGGLGAQRFYYGVGDYGIRGTSPAAHSAIGLAF